MRCWSACGSTAVNSGKPMRALCQTMICLAVTWVLVRAALAQTPDANQVDYFESRVRPLLIDNCFSCHSEKKQQGGLRLDSRLAILTGGETGPAAVEGQPEESLLVEAINYR